MWILMMRKRNCSEWRTHKKPVGKAAYFTNIFTNFAGTNMRKYETIWENTLVTQDFRIVQKPSKIKRLRRNTGHLRRYSKMIKILFICHGKTLIQSFNPWKSRCQADFISILPRIYHFYIRPKLVSLFQKSVNPFTVGTRRVGIYRRKYILPISW